MHPGQAVAELEMTAQDDPDQVTPGSDREEPAPAPVADLLERADLDLGYQVQLDAFSGPLDLLLFLVRRAEVDITEIAIAAIADQFIATIQGWEEMDLDVAGDFILMAASLLEFKARIVAPPVEEERDEEEDEADFLDPREDLISQLLAFRRVKEAVLELEALEEGRQQRHTRHFQEQVPVDPDEDQGLDLANADPGLLFQVWDRLLVSVAAQAPRRVLYDDIPIEERMRQLEGTLRASVEARLSWILEKTRTPIQRCGVVVALLECIRQRMMEAVQHEQFGDVHLSYVAEDARSHADEGPPPEVSEEGGRRRRKRPPLFTYALGVLAEDEGAEVPLPSVVEEVIETEEQRFLRELNEQIGVDDLLERIADLDTHLNAHLRELGVAVEDEALPEGDGSVAVLPEDAVPAADPADRTLGDGDEEQAFDDAEDDDDDDDEDDDDDDDDEEDEEDEEE